MNKRLLAFPVRQRHKDECAQPHKELNTRYHYDFAWIFVFFYLLFSGFVNWKGHSTTNKCPKMAVNFVWWSGVWRISPELSPFFRIVCKHYKNMKVSIDRKESAEAVSGFLGQQKYPKVPTIIRISHTSITLPIKHLSA